MNATVATYALYLVIAKLRERATWKSSPPPLHPTGIPYSKA